MKTIIILFSLKVLFFSVSIITFSACNTEDICEDLIDNPLRITFYANVEGSLMPVGVDSITVIGLGMTDSIYANSYNVSRIEIPLDPTRDSCGFVFIFPQSNDTIHIQYLRSLSLASIECGFITLYDLIDIETTGNIIRNFDIKQNNITNINEEHIHFILHSVFD